jgi:hypothetical protein
MNSEVSTAIYRRPILSTCDTGRYKYRIVVHYKQEGTGMTTTQLKVERCSFEQGVWEIVEHD